MILNTADIVTEYNYSTFDLESLTISSSGSVVLGTVSKDQLRTVDLKLQISQNGNYLFHEERIIHNGTTISSSTPSVVSSGTINYTVVKYISGNDIIFGLSVTNAATFNADVRYEFKDTFPV